LPETDHNESDPKTEEDDPRNEKRPRAREHEGKHRRTDERDGRQHEGIHHHRLPAAMSRKRAAAEYALELGVLG
jgi:hypothetical protein